jgi:pimeloyl-ACP methyl ester carboxylesterase
MHRARPSLRRAQACGPPDADLSAAGCGTLIADALDALGLEEVTLVGNDSGGAYCQIALSDRPGHVARLVLTSCETPYDQFPPEPFDGLPVAAEDPQTLGRLLSTLEDPDVRRLPAAFGLLVKHPLDTAISDAYALPCIRDSAVLRDTPKVLAGASTAAVHDAGATLIRSWPRPVLFVWSGEDPVFAVEHAHRYAEALTDARVIELDDCYSFTPEDQPAALAQAIGAFAGESALGLRGRVAAE